MTDPTVSPLKIVDGLDLNDEYRRVLRPGELVFDDERKARRLPRFFYEVESLATARETQLAPNFGLYEFIHTDLREDRLLWGFPKYLPCAVTMLAAHLAVLRKQVGTYVHIAANGAYRSPAHALSRNATTHHWGTAANLYRIGDDYLDTPDLIERYSAIIRDLLPGVWIRPYGHTAGFADDHLHIDLGYVTVVPRDSPGEAIEE